MAKFANVTILSHNIINTIAVPGPYTGMLYLPTINTILRGDKLPVQFNKADGTPGYTIKYGEEPADDLKKAYENGVMHEAAIEWILNHNGFKLNETGFVEPVEIQTGDEANVNNDAGHTKSGDNTEDDTDTPAGNVDVSAGDEGAGESSEGEAVNKAGEDEGSGSLIGEETLETSGTGTETDGSNGAEDNKQADDESQPEPANADDAGSGNVGEEATGAAAEEGLANVQQANKNKNKNKNR